LPTLPHIGVDLAVGAGKVQSTLTVFVLSFGLAQLLAVRTIWWKLHQGKIFHKNFIGMRSFVSTPIQAGRLFLAGDCGAYRSANRQPPTTNRQPPHHFDTVVDAFELPVCIGQRALTTIPRHSAFSLLASLPDG
jgi:hypothetical protein